MHWYLHVDIDAFFVSVERALNPALKGRPVIVGGASGRGVVTSASYEARKCGVHSAMPAFQAKRLCPQAIFLPNRRRIYSEFSHRVFAVLEHYSPEVQAISIDEGLVDLTGTERLLGPPLMTADEIIKRIGTEVGLPCSGGLSTSRIVAKIAVTLAKPHGLIYVPEGSQERFLSPLPVSAIPGIGPKTHKELLQRGITTIGSLLGVPELRDRYLDLREEGKGGRSHDHSIGSETTLDSPLRDLEKMEAVLQKLVEEVGGRLRREGVYARCITLKVRHTNFKTITRSRTLPTPTCFDREIFGVARELLRKNVARGEAVRLLGISSSGLQSSGVQQSILDFQKRLTLEKLYQGIDRMRDRYGERAITTGSARARAR